MTGRKEQVFLILTLIIGAVVGLIVVAFILLTERFGARQYPAGGAAWRRVLIPTIGSLRMGYLLFRFFPDARGSGVPQTKAALYARERRILARQFWESSLAHPPRWQAEYRWEEKAHRFK
jgi:chloride channel protein, CIC family